MPKIRYDFVTITRTHHSMCKHFRVILHGRNVDLMASSKSSALLNALEFYPNQKIYRVIEMGEWDDDNEE